jgi:hypothetical protein
MIYSMVKMDYQEEVNTRTGFWGVPQEEVVGGGGE